jgi:hypothetical protein
LLAGAAQGALDLFARAVAGAGGRGREHGGVHRRPGPGLLARCGEQLAAGVGELVDADLVALARAVAVAGQMTSPRPTSASRRWPAARRSM